MSATNYSQRNFTSVAVGNASLKVNNAKSNTTKTNKQFTKSCSTSQNAAHESNLSSDTISKEDKVVSSYLFMLRMADNFAKQLNYHESIRSAEAALFLRIRKADIIEPKLKELVAQDKSESHAQSIILESSGEGNQSSAKVKKSKQHHRHSKHREQEEETSTHSTQSTRSDKAKDENKKEKRKKKSKDVSNVDGEPSFLYSALHHSVMEQVKELLLRCNTYAVEEFSHDKYDSASFFLDKALFLTSQRTYVDAEEENEMTNESSIESNNEKVNEKEEWWNESIKTDSGGAVNSRTTSITSANAEKDNTNTEKGKEEHEKKMNKKKKHLIVLFHDVSDNNEEDVERLRLHAATLNNFGCMERRRGRYIKSLEYFQQAIRVQIGLTNDVMYTYPDNNIKSNNIQDNTIRKVEDVKDERELGNNEYNCMDKLPSLLLSLASSYCNLNLLYNDMFMYAEAVAAAQRAIHVLEQAQETMTEMEHLLLMHSSSNKSKKREMLTTKTKTETKMLLRMLMMAYHNLGISLMRKSEASNNTNANLINKTYPAGSIGSNRASLQSTLTAASVANDQEEMVLAQHAFKHAQAIRNRLALAEHKSTNKESNTNTNYGNNNEPTTTTTTTTTTTKANAKEETHLSKMKLIDIELELTSWKQNESKNNKEVNSTMQTPLHVKEAQQVNAKSAHLQLYTEQNNSNYNVHVVVDETTSPLRLAQTCSPLTLNAVLQRKTNNLIEEWNEKPSDKTNMKNKDDLDGNRNDHTNHTRNEFMSTAPAKLYNLEGATENSQKQAANLQQELLINKEKSMEVQRQEEEGANVSLPPINKCSSTSTTKDEIHQITNYTESKPEHFKESEQEMEKNEMISKCKEGLSGNDDHVNNKSSEDIVFTAPITTNATLTLPTLEERKTSKTKLSQQVLEEEKQLEEKKLQQKGKDEETTHKNNLVNSKESSKENVMDHISANNEKGKLHTQTSSPLLPPISNTNNSSTSSNNNNIINTKDDDDDDKNNLYKRISISKEFDARNASTSLTQNQNQNQQQSQSQSTSQRQRRSILDRINDRLKSTNSLSKINNNNTLAEGNLFANSTRKKSSLVASVNNNTSNVRNQRHSRKSLIASKNKLYRKEQAELANQMINALEHKVQLEERQQRRRAAITIQKIVKGVLVRTELSVKHKAILLLQRNVRIFLCKVRIIHAHEARIKFKEEQLRREKELKAAISIQRRLRSFLQRVHEQQEIAAQARRLHHAACVIQLYYRKYCRRKLIKQQEEQRAHELAKRQEHFIQRHAAMRIAQAYKEYKHKCTEELQKKEMESKLNAVLVIQSHWRGAQARAWYYYALRASRERQLQSSITQSFVQIIQRYVWSELAQRSVYHHQCLQLMEKHRLRLHHAAAQIQSCWRGHVGRIHAERVRFEHECECRHAMEIQQWWRARMTRFAFVEHFDRIIQHKAALLIQKWWMQCKEDRKAREFASYHARLLEQQRLRTVHVMCAQTLKKFIECKQSLQLVHKRKELLIKKCYACRLIQRASRAFQLRRRFQLEQEVLQRCILQERQEQIRKYAAQVIQRAWRLAWSKIQKEKEQEKLHAVNVIESAWQIYKCKCIKHELATAKRHAMETHAAMIIQRALRHWRRRIILHDLATYYTQRQRMHKCLLRKNEAVTQIAACWRGYVTRREVEQDRLQWHKMNVSAFTLQRAWHRYLTAKEKKRIDALKRNYDIRIREDMNLEELKKWKAALCIQCAYRRLCARQCVYALRERRIKEIHAAVRIQCAWRVHIALTKFHFLQTCQAQKDALAIETLLQWNRHMTLVQCFIKALMSNTYIQSQYYTYLYNKLDERVKFELERRVHAAICIQALYRGHLGRRIARNLEIAQWREQERLIQLAAQQVQHEQIILQATLHCQRIGKSYLCKKTLASLKMEAEQMKEEKERIMPPEQVVQQLFAKYNASQNVKIQLGKKCQVLKRKWAARIIEKAMHSYLHTLRVKEYNEAKQKQHAARCIVHNWHLYKERKECEEQKRKEHAAIIIQKTVRMYLARRLVHTMREKLHEERVKRLEMYAILDSAACVIQNQWRVMHARRDALLRKREREAKREAEQRNDAASVIQQVYRNYRERCRVYVT